MKKNMFKILYSILVVTLLLFSFNSKQTTNAYDLTNIHNLIINSTNCEIVTDEDISTIIDGLNYSFIFKANDGYYFTDDSVNLNGDYSSFTFDKTTGELIVKEITSDLTINISAVKGDYTLTISFINCSDSQTNSSAEAKIISLMHGEDYSLIIYPNGIWDRVLENGEYVSVFNSKYHFTSESVQSNSKSYSFESGELIITDISDDIEITITAYPDTYNITYEINNCEPVHQLPTSIEYGESILLEFTPHEGYCFDYYSTFSGEGYKVNDYTDYNTFDYYGRYSTGNYKGLITQVTSDITITVTAYAYVNTGTESWCINSLDNLTFIEDLGTSSILAPFNNYFAEYDFIDFSFESSDTVFSQMLIKENKLYFANGDSEIGIVAYGENGYSYNSENKYLSFKFSENYFILEKPGYYAFEFLTRNFHRMAEDNQYILEQSLKINLLDVIEDNNSLQLKVNIPLSLTGELQLTSVNISKTEELDIKNYKLSLLEEKSNEEYSIYLVNDFSLETGKTRLYVIPSIFRNYNEIIDGEQAEDQTITEKAIEVSAKYTFEDDDKGTTVTYSGIKVITVTNKFVGFVRYENGFLSLNSSCDAHFIAFSTDLDIDKLLEADVYYTTQSYSYRKGGTIIITENETYGDINENYVHLTNGETAEYLPGGWFSQYYSWYRITSVEDFISYLKGLNIGVDDNSQLDDETMKELLKNSWVLSFAETEYYEGIINTATATNGIDKTIVGDVSILRLAFETAGQYYNLATTDDKVTGSEDPVITVEPEANIWEKVKEFFKNAWEKVKEFFVNAWEFIKTILKTIWETVKEVYDKILYIILALLAIIIVILIFKNRKK